MAYYVRNNRALYVDNNTIDSNLSSNAFFDLVADNWSTTENNSNNPLRDLLLNALKAVHDAAHIESLKYGSLQILIINHFEHFLKHDGTLEILINQLLENSLGDDNQRKLSIANQLANLNNCFTNLRFKLVAEGETLVKRIKGSKATQMKKPAVYYDYIIIAVFLLGCIDSPLIRSTPAITANQLINLYDAKLANHELCPNYSISEKGVVNVLKFEVVIENWEMYTRFQNWLLFINIFRTGNIWR